MDAKVNSIPTRRRRRRRQRLAQRTNTLLSDFYFPNSNCLTIIVCYIYLGGEGRKRKRVTYHTIQEKHTLFSGFCFMILSGPHCNYFSISIVQIVSIDRVPNTWESLSTRLDPTILLHTDTLHAWALFFPLDCLVIDKMLQVYTSV